MESSIINLLNNVYYYFYDVSIIIVAILISYLIMKYNEEK